MGYMGFGMQSWVYKRRPRKPFSKRGEIPSFSPLPKYSRTFSIKPHIKENKYKYVFWGFIFFVSFVFLINISIKKFTLYSINHSNILYENSKRIDYGGFHFLIKSGKKRLLSNNILGAYSEFNLAYKINPKNDELNQLLVETLSILCTKDIEYCNKLDYHLIQKH